MDGSALLHMDHAVALQSENLTAVMEALSKAEIEKLMDEQGRREQQVDADKLKQYDAALGGLINALNQAMASMNASGGVAISIKGIVTSIEGMRAAIQLHLAKIALQENKNDASVTPVLASLDGKLIAPQDAQAALKTDAKLKPVGIAVQAAKFEKYLTTLKDNKALPFPIRAIIENVLNSLQKLGVSSRTDLKSVIINSMTPRQPANDITARIEARKAANNDNHMKGEKTEDLKADGKLETKSQAIKGETPNGEPKLGLTSDAKTDVKLTINNTFLGERLAVTADTKSALSGIIISAASVAINTATVSVGNTFANTLGAVSATASIDLAPVTAAPATIIPSSVASTILSPSGSAPLTSVTAGVTPTIVAHANLIPTSAAPAVAMPLALVTVLSEYRASHPTTISTVVTPTVVTPTINVMPTTLPITPTHVAPTTPNPIQTNEAIGGGIPNSYVAPNPTPTNPTDGAVGGGSIAPIGETIGGGVVGGGHNVEIRTADHPIDCNIHMGERQDVADKVSTLDSTVRSEFKDTSLDTTQRNDQQALVPPSVQERLDVVNQQVLDFKAKYGEDNYKKAPGYDDLMDKRDALQKEKREEEKKKPESERPDKCKGCVSDCTLTCG